jgi:hypothetical protein
MSDKLTTNDPEPPEGTVVRTEWGQLWERVDGPWGGTANWLMMPRTADTDWDPETWVKVAGNYGPVEIVE